ncbi:SAF domain-containing protein [uncultured Enterovirga sp.]|uniref:SAF domain-containing protein n=1 Tax=uncultured Enterovirga sp. TaxID=2026352 RepID=UPI0035C97ADA
MQFATLFAPARSRSVTAGLVGCGEFGLSLIAQSRRMEGLTVAAVVDRDPERARASLAEMDVDARLCGDLDAARAALEVGAVAICASVELLLALPIEIMVEATGDPEAGARFAEAAIEAGRGVAMVSKEAECVVGPILARKARARQVPYTLVDGDQPSLLIGLVSWARVLGLPVIAAGKSSEYDYVFDPDAGTVTWTDLQAEAPRLDEVWHLEGRDIATVLDARAAQVSALPLRTVPDYCEMCLVANATGLRPDRPDFHAPLTRTTELPDVYCPRAEGGVLERSGVLDVFNCLRQAEDASFAGGVFVVVELADEKTGHLFAGKGIPTSCNRRYGLVYNPSHLLGVEAPISIVAAARLGHDMLDEAYRPVCDLVARAERDLPAGRCLDIVGLRHAVPDLQPLLVDAAPARGSAPLPYYMAVGRTLVRPVRRGAWIRADDVDQPVGSVLWRLRAEQDAAFFLA